MPDFISIHRKKLLNVFSVQGDAKLVGALDLMVCCKQVTEGVQMRVFCFHCQNKYVNKLLLSTFFSEQVHTVLFSY